MVLLMLAMSVVSRVSHLPAKYRGGSSSSRVVGLGMNAEELKKNPQLTEYVASACLPAAGGPSLPLSLSLTG